MVPILALWLPILLAAVIVFVVSSLLHMVLPYHKGDYRGLPNESDGDGRDAQGRRAARRLHDAARRSMAALKDPGVPRQVREGPGGGHDGHAGRAAGDGRRSWPSGSSTAWWSASSRRTSRAARLQPGAHYLAVFRFAGATAFVGYALALWQDSIWYKKQLSTTVKNTIDGLIYGLLTGGVFGWLWPR